MIILTSRPADRYRLLSERCNTAEPSNILHLHEGFLHRFLEKLKYTLKNEPVIVQSKQINMIHSRFS